MAQKLKNKATSNIKVRQRLFSSPLNDARIYLGDGPLEIGLRIVDFHTTKRTQWVAHVNRTYFGSYG